jgi:hypothetical protein
MDKVTWGDRLIDGMAEAFGHPKTFLACIITGIAIGVGAIVAPHP